MKQKLLFIFVIILTLSLRLFKVGDVPATLYGDEQAFAYNAYSIMLSGKDEYGTPFPLEFRSFDDYKAPIPVYGLVPFIRILGLNAFAIRLPVVIASVLTVFVTYFLVRRFLAPKVALISAFFLAISPWYIHLSRGYFEATIALFWFIVGIYFFIRNGKLISKLISMLFFAMAIYSYFTPRILIPIFIVFLIFYEAILSKSFQNAKSVLLKNVVPILLLIVLAFPLTYSSFFGKGLTRFQKLSESMYSNVVHTVNRERATSNLPLSINTLLHNKLTVRLRMIKDNYLEHLSLNFWYIFGDNSLRYFTGNMGMFYLVELPFFIVGLWSMWKRHKQAALFFVSWILLAPIPAALVGRSFAVRSLAMLPAPFIFVAYGMKNLVDYINRRFLNSSTSGESPSQSLRAGIQPPPRCLYRLGFLGGISLIFSASLLFHQIKYYFEYPVYAATWWGWENKAAIDYSKERENQYDYIFLSDFYTGMPLTFAVYNQIDPLVYRQAVYNPITLADDRHLIQLGKYFIGSLDIDSSRLESGIIPSRSLYIGRPEEAPSDETIRSPDDGRTLFRIYKTN